MCHFKLNYLENSRAILFTLSLVLIYDAATGKVFVWKVLSLEYIHFKLKVVLCTMFIAKVGLLLLYILEDCYIK